MYEFRRFGDAKSVTNTRRSEGRFVFFNMSTFKFALLGLLHLFTSLALGSKCPQDDISKLVVCYYEGRVSLGDFNLCNCTHVVFTNAVDRAQINNISITEETVRGLEIIKETKKDLSAIFTLEGKEEDTAKILKSEKRSLELVNAISEFLLESQFDGVEINFRFNPEDGVSKESFALFLKNLSKTLSSHGRRIKRAGYDVFENLDDITTASYTTQTPKNSTAKAPSIKQRNRKRKDIDQEVREGGEEEPDDKDYLTLEEGGTSEKDAAEEDVFEEKNLLLFVRLPLKLEIIAKKYDLKALSRYAEILVVPTHDITTGSEQHLTYHPSRLMGLADILNTDSILDFLTGMGGLKSKMVISMPATVLKFELEDENENTPRAPARSKPQVIDQSQLCTLFSNSNWTVEREDDLTAPYAYSGKSWLAFEDEISVNVKGKYILLRELAGGAIFPIDADLGDGFCPNRTKSSGFLTGVLHGNFESLGRKPRALALESLQEEIHDSAYAGVEAGLKLSEYRIVRVVDHSGAVHVIRKNTKTQFECSRQGYFSHPLGCNKFYRCVKFDQYSDEFTVFEYDCPVGLAFDERWEVCVWPGSLPHGAPCTGSSEIAPVPRSHYRCPNREGYFADPENCRWFFACLDHAKDGITPLTAYEFRCPFGLVFSEEKLACDWPWLVGSCGNAGAAGFLQVHSGGRTRGIHTATFVNGGNLEASLGQFGDAAAASFLSFGSEFGSVLKGAKYNAEGPHQRGQSPGSRHISSRYNDDRNRASFASFPDYEISGGRIVNKGGVVLVENIAKVSGAAVAADNIGENVVGNEESRGRSFGKGAEYFNEELRSAGGLYSGGVLTAQQPKPSPEILKHIGTNLNTSGRTSAVYVQQQNPTSTPTPFSVNVPSVQINSEYSGASTVGPTAAQNVLLTPTSPETEVIGFHQRQQHSTSQGFTGSQASLAFVTPSVTHGFGDVLSGASPVSTAPSSFGTTSKPDTHSFIQSGFQQSELSGNFKSTPLIEGQSFGYSLGGRTASKPVSVSIPLVAPKSQLQGFGYTSTGQVSDFLRPTEPTRTPFTGFTRQDQTIGHQNSVRTGLGKSPAFAQIPEVQSHNFKSLDVEQSSASGNAALGQIEVSYGASVATVAPQVYSSEGDAGVRLSFASSRPTSTNSQGSSIDEKVSNELYLNTPQSSLAAPPVTPKFELFSKTASGPVTISGNAVSSKISIATPKLDFPFSQTRQRTFGTFGVADKGNTAVLYSFPAATQQVDFGFHEGRGSIEGGPPVIPKSFSGSTTVTGNRFLQTGSVGISKEFPKVSFSAPGVTPLGQIRTVEQKTGSSLTEKTSYSVPTPTSEDTTDDGVRVGVSRSFLQPTVFQPAQQSVYGQAYFSEHHANNIGSSGAAGPNSSPTAFEASENPLPKIQQEEISTRQQPIATVGAINSAGADLTVSTPQSLQQHSSAVTHIDFNSKYQQHVPASAPVPPASITYKPLSRFVNVFAEPPQTVALTTQQQQPKSIGIETSGQPLPQTLVNVPDVTFDEKSSNLFSQEFKSFTPVASVTESKAYLSPVTPKVGTFGATVQRGFPSSTKSVQFIQHHVTTPASDYEQRVQTQSPVVTTSKPFAPRETLVGLEISKSVELNPSQFFQSSGGYHSQENLAKSIEFHQQPLHLISQKTIPKQVIQPFFKERQKDFEGNGYEEQSPLSWTEFGEQKQKFSPAVTSKPLLSTSTYEAAKTVNFGEDGSVPALPLFQAPKVPVIIQKKLSGDGYPVPAVETPVRTVFVGQQPEEVSSRTNLALPTAATVSQFASQADKLSSHGSFQKINKNVNPAAENYLQRKLSLDTFDTSDGLFQSTHNFTAGIGGSVFKSGTKYAINPNIAIPEPPREYYLVQNAVTTSVPEFPSTSSSKIQLESIIEGGLKASPDVPPTFPSRKASKATLISIGSLDEDDIRHDTMQQLFDKYSGRFGEVINGRNGKFVTKVIKENAKGEIVLKEPGASVQYEISSTSHRPNVQERQYHGGITSGVKAASKYEEYEINGVGEGRRNLDGSGDSKTTLDLKNLKLDKNKKTVIVVSQVSDANPILVGKLAGQCSCQSNMLHLRNKNRKSDSSRTINKNSPTISNKYLPPYETAAAADIPGQGAASTAAPETVVIDGSKSSKLDITHTTEHYLSSSTTVHPSLVSSNILSSLGPDAVLSITPKTVYAEDKPRSRKTQFRGRTRYLPSSSALLDNAPSLALASGVTASEIASTFDYSALRGDESRSQNKIEGAGGYGSEKGGAGAAFDRYGPGGWRGFDEVLQGSVDCKRPGLFRHPKYCNKFYACNYDPWKERYTLHVFNCPIHLTYDSSISACNWPVRGPACADDNLLV